MLASSIVQGHFAEQHVPFHIRNLILAESGANDGLGYPFLFLAVYLLQMPTGQAIGKWFYWILAFQILLSTVIGFVVGFIARKALKFAEQKQIIDKESFLVYAVALAVSEYKKIIIMRWLHTNQVPFKMTAVSYRNCFYYRK